MTIKETSFDGVQAIELLTDSVRLVAVTEFGPRLAFLGKPNGENMLLWAPQKYTRGDWDLRGGHRVWVTTPGADECEDTYAVDNDACEYQIGDDGFVVVGAENPINKTRRGLRISVVNDTMLEVDNFVINTGDMLYSGGLWALTCTLPTDGATYAIPIGDGSSWDNFNMVFFREWAGHGKGGFNDPQIEIGNDLVTVKPAGNENKRMLQSHAGIIAMSDPVNKTTFAKHVSFDPAGNYPLNTNIAFYIGPDNFMVEMETMGSEETIKPGAELHHIETWVLKDGATEFNSAETVHALFNV